MSGWLRDEWKILDKREFDNFQFVSPEEKTELASMLQEWEGRTFEEDVYKRQALTIDADYEGEETFDLVKKVQNTAEEYYPGAWLLAGEGVSTYDLMRTVTADMKKVNLIAIAAVFTVLLLTMKSICIPAILVLSLIHI